MTLLNYQLRPAKPQDITNHKSQLQFGCFKQTNLYVV